VDPSGADRPELQVDARSICDWNTALISTFTLGLAASASSCGLRRTHNPIRACYP